MVSKKQNPLLVKDGKGKSIPKDQRLSLLGKPCDANFLSFYLTFTL